MPAPRTLNPKIPNNLNPIKRIDRLYRTGLDLLTREMEHIRNLAMGGKLEAGPSRDLVNYVKLLGEMKKAAEATQAEKAAKDKAAKKQVSDEELEKAISGAVPISSSSPVNP